jgi:fimbrial chaperone protein
MKTPAAYLLVVLALGFGPPVAAAPPEAAKLEIAPTTFDLKPGEPGIFYIVNRGHDDVEVQIQAREWRQENGQDRLSPSDSLFASPAFIRIAPNRRQVVRLLADAAGPPHEREYRLLVNEIPHGNAPRDSVRVLLQFSIPVFVSSGAMVPPSIAWSAIRRGDGLQVVARNRGAETIKLVGAAIRAGSTGDPLATSNLTYILPNAAHFWPVARTPAQGTIHLSARDERSGADIQAEIPITR